MAPVHTLPLSYQYKIFTHGTSPHIATLLLVYHIYPWHQSTHCHSATSTALLRITSLYISTYTFCLLWCTDIYPWHQPTHCHSATSIKYLPMAPAHTMPLSYQYSSPSYHFFIHFYIHFLLVIFMLLPNLKLEWVIIQLMTFDEVITRIDQPMEHDIHRGYPRWISCSMGWSILVFTEIESH